LPQGVINRNSTKSAAFLFCTKGGGIAQKKEGENDNRQLFPTKIILFTIGRSVVCYNKYSRSSGIGNTAGTNT
jgi:hypothetical protein